MKNFFPLVAASVVLICLVACNPFDRSGRSLMHISFPSKEQRVIVKSDRVSLDIKYSGDIVFNEEETAIEKMSPGGYLDYSMNDKRLVAEATPGGGVVYKFYDDDYLTGEGTGKKFLVTAIREMIAQGMFLEGRIERLYQDGGVPLVLEEAGKAKADHVKKQYLEYILKSDSLSKPDLVRVAKFVGNSINSDDDKRRMLERMPAIALEDSIISLAYFNAIETMGSDHDKSNALRHALEQSLPAKTFFLAIKAAATINSEHDKANLVRELVKHDNSSEESFLGMLSVISNINNDHEKSTVLNILIDHAVYPGETFSKLCKEIAKMNADHEKSTVFRKLADKNITTEDDWVTFLNETATINTNHDKANVLVAASKRIPRTEKVLAAYMQTAKTIDNEHEYKEVVKPVI